MIIVTRLNGNEVIINADLIETVESTPDTIMTLVDGTRYLLEESPGTIVERVKAYRAAVLRLGDNPVVERPTDQSPGADPDHRADVVSLPVRNED